MGKRKGKGKRIGKKKIIIFLSIVLVILMLFGFLLGYHKYKNDSKQKQEQFIIDSTITSTITMDINPSIEINLNRENKVVTIKALNEDAKIIIDNNDFGGNDIEDTMNIIFDSLIVNKYLSDENNIVLIGIKTSDNNLEKIVKDNINSVTQNKQIKTELIILSSDKIKELESVAKINNITTAKAYYINEQIKDDNNLKIEDYKDVSINEIKEKINEYKKEQEIIKEQEEKKNEENKNTVNNQNTENNQNTVTNKKTYTCTPPSDIKDIEWCEWNNKRPRNCEFRYDQIDMSLVTDKAIQYLNITDRTSLYGDSATPVPYKGASYCEAYQTVITTTEYRYKILWDSKTGEYISETKEAVPAFALTKEEALEKGLAEYSLNKDTCKNCWVVVGTDKEGSSNWYYRYQVNMDINEADGSISYYTVNINAVTGAIVDKIKRG